MKKIFMVLLLLVVQSFAVYSPTGFPNGIRVGETISPDSSEYGGNGKLTVTATTVNATYISMGATGIATDIISEKTSAHGVSIDGLLVKDGGVTAISDVILSGTAANIRLGSNYLSGDGGDEGVFVSSNGNVGIGTTAPTAKLEIQQTGVGSPLLLHAVTGAFGDYNGIDFAFNDDASAQTLYATLQAGIISNNAGAIKGNLQFYTRNGTTTEKMRIAHDGNVGIGTYAPSTKLEVAGTVSANDVVNYDVDLFNNGATVVGFSSYTTADCQIQLIKIGKTVFVYFQLSGVSNATGTSIQVPDAFVTKTGTKNIRVPGGIGYDNGVIQTNNCYIDIPFGGNGIFAIQKNIVGDAWTASGTKIISGEFWYRTN